MQAVFSGAFAFVGMLALFMAAKFVKRSRQRARESRLRLPGDEVSSVTNDYGSIPRERTDWYGGDPTSQVASGERPFVAASYYPEHPRWFI